MNFMTRIIVFVFVLISPLSSKAEHPLCTAKSLKNRIPYCNEIPGDIPWHRTYIAERGGVTKILPRLGIMIRYQLKKLDHANFVNVDSLALTYHIKTEDGTAKAPRHYDSMDEARVWKSRPSAWEGHSLDNLYIGRPPFKNESDIIFAMHKPSKNQTPCNHPEYEEDATYEGKFRYFYVVLYNPWLEIHGDKCEGNFQGDIRNINCKNPKRMTDSGYVSNWEQSLVSHNTPREIRYLVLVKQQGAVAGGCQ